MITRAGATSSSPATVTLAGCVTSTFARSAAGSETRTRTDPDPAGFCATVPATGSASSTCCIDTCAVWSPIRFAASSVRTTLLMSESSIGSTLAGSSPSPSAGAE